MRSTRRSRRCYGAEADIVHRKLAQYKGEQLEGLDVKTLGVLLAEMDAARTRVRGGAAAEAAHELPRRLRLSDHAGAHGRPARVRDGHS